MTTEAVRRAFFGSADRQHLAPLWTRLKSLVPTEPAPVGVPHRWAYADVPPHVLEAAEHISRWAGAARPYRSSDGTVFIGVEGRGELRVGEQRLPIAPHDIVVVPGWIGYTLQAEDDVVLFSCSDRAAQDKLGLWREQRG